MITEQARDHREQGIQEEEKRVPEHAGRMRGVGGEVNNGARKLTSRRW